MSVLQNLCSSRLRPPLKLDCLIQRQTRKLKGFFSHRTGVSECCSILPQQPFYSTRNVYTSNVDRPEIIQSKHKYSFTFLAKQSSYTYYSKLNTGRIKQKRKPGPNDTAPSTMLNLTIKILKMLKAC